MAARPIRHDHVGGTSTDDRMTALIHAVTERQWQTAISLLEAHWPYYFNAHLAQLLDVLSALPPHMMAQNPRLRVGRDYLVHMLSGGRKTRVFHEVAADGAARTPMDRFADLTAQSAARAGSARPRLSSTKRTICSAISPARSCAK